MAPRTTGLNEVLPPPIGWSKIKLSLNALSLVKAWIDSKVECDGKDDKLCDPERVWTGRDITQQEIEATMRFENFVYNRCLSGDHPLILPEDPSRPAAIKEACAYLSKMHMFNLRWDGKIWKEIQGRRVSREQDSDSDFALFDCDSEDWLADLIAKEDYSQFGQAREATPAPSSRENDRGRARDATPVPSSSKKETKNKDDDDEDDDMPDWHKEALKMMGTAVPASPLLPCAEYPDEFDDGDFGLF